MIHKYILDLNNRLLFDRYLEAKKEMTTLRIEHWYKYEFLSLQWFGIIFISIIFITVWWRLLDKKRLIEMLLFGFFIATSAAIMDGVGTEFNAWEYSVKVLPVFFPLIVVDLMMLPLILMLLYQFFTEWKGFLVAITITSAIFSFIVEPMVEYTGIYQTFAWKYYYSFPIYILMGLINKWLMQAIICRQKRESKYDGQSTHSPN